MSVPYYGDFPEDFNAVNIPFNTFDSNDPSASVTITDLVDADIKVHKDAHVDQIVTDGATVVINFDGITGNHMINIDTSIDAAYATGSEYQVRIEGTTVDGGTINAFVGTFSIERAGGTLALIKAGVTLAEDAIKAVSYDESTAFPLKANDAGATQIARVGADGDTLETLSDQADLQATLAICTEARLAELDAANIPTDIANLNNIAASDVWDEASSRTDDFGTLLEQLADWHFNEKTVTDATGAVVLRNQGDSADFANWGITDNATLTVSTEVVWV